MSLPFLKSDASVNILKSYNLAKELFPLLATDPSAEENVGRIISPYTLQLPRHVLNEAQACVKTVYNYAHSEDQHKKLQNDLSKTPELLSILNLKTSSDSVLMAYDFHVQADGSQLELIEINTNASGYLYSLIHQKLAGIDSTPALNNLKNAFTSAATGREKKADLRIAITDENIPAQKMYLEFLMFKSFFKNTLGWSPELVEVKDLVPEHFDFIYNRSTDFYFENALSSKLLTSYLAQENKITPHPRDYLLFADKERLIDFSAAGISKNILSITPLSTQNADSLWEERKNLFFKPMRSFGAKGAYRGASISRKVFERITQEPYLAQKFSSPGEIDGWKFDLRFYVFGSEIHHTTARIYKGQVTGFNEPGSGFASVNFY